MHCILVLPFGPRWGFAFLVLRPDPSSFHYCPRLPLFGVGMRLRSLVALGSGDLPWCSASFRPEDFLVSLGYLAGQSPFEGLSSRWVWSASLAFLLPGVSTPGQSWSFRPVCIFLLGFFMGPPCWSFVLRHLGPPHLLFLPCFAVGSGYFGFFWLRRHCSCSLVVCLSALFFLGVRRFGIRSFVTDEEDGREW